jgi:hypothetical protein
MKSLWRKEVYALLLIGEGLAIAFSLGYWFPNWSINWLMRCNLKAKKEYFMGG